MGFFQLRRQCVRSIAESVRGDSSRGWSIYAARFSCSFSHCSCQPRRTTLLSAAHTSCGSPVCRGRRSLSRCSALSVRRTSVCSAPLCSSLRSRGRPNLLRCMLCKLLPLRRLWQQKSMPVLPPTLSLLNSRKSSNMTFRAFFIGSVRLATDSALIVRT